MNKPAIPVCPRCDSAAGFHQADLGDDRTAWLMYFFGGGISYLLYQAGRRGKTRCENCGCLFRHPRRLKRTDLAVLTLIFGGVAVACLYFTFGS